MRNSETKEEPAFTPAGELGDFTATSRLLPISAAAIIIGVIASFVALALLKLIGLFTNLFYFQRWSTDLVSPAGHHLGSLAVLVPIAGALIIGLMARYGSERIRGHGIPEAIESILLNGSRVAAEACDLEAAFIRNLHRIGRPVRRRGTDHHDGRRIRIDDRAVISSDAALSVRRCWWLERLRVCPQPSPPRCQLSCWQSNCCCLNGSLAV